MACAAVAATVIISFCGAGCADSNKGAIIEFNSSNKSSNEKRLTFVGYKGGMQNVIAIEESLQGFMKVNPSVTITYEYAPGVLSDLLKRRLTAGTLDDVFTVDLDSYQYLKSKDALMDLSDIPGIENYLPLMKNQFDLDGKAYFVPACITTYGLYVNYDLLKKHGLSIPQNYSEFKTVCDYFVGKGVTPVIGNNDNTFRALIAAIGFFDIYREQNPNTEIARLNNDIPALLTKLKPAVERIAEMLDKGYIDSGAIDSTYPTRLTSDNAVGELSLFLKGEQPFMITGNWASPRVTAAGCNFSYGVHALPVMDDGVSLVMDGNTCLAVNKKTKYPAEVKNFMSFLMDKDNMWKYCESQSSYTPLKNDSRIPSDKTIAPSAEYLNGNRTVISLDYKWSLPIKQAFTKCGMEMTKAAREGKVSSNEILKILENDLLTAGGI